MKIRLYHKVLVFLSAFMFVISCGNSEIADPVLTVSTGELTFEAEGGESTITIDCNDAWSVNNAASWLQLSQTSGSSGTAVLTFTTMLNNTGATRFTTLVVSSSNGQARRITVSQASLIFPSYNTSPQAPDITGMSSTATELIAKIALGVNIGNTLELRGVQPDPTEAYVKFVKQCGFNAVRIPGGWNQSADQSTAKINDAYLAKVKQVVQWCVDNDLYVLLNIHWDGGWLENNCTVVKKDSVNAKQKAFWEQIATTMRDFDEHLMFASANEPNADDTEQMGVLLSYHQTFINAVRSTGGRNTYRTLVLQGHTDHINTDNFPADPTPNRLAFEWHTYTPSSFTILYDDKVNGGWDDVRFYWSEVNHSAIEPGRNCSYGEEAELLEGFNQIKTQFIDKGIPCIMGEYSAQRWTETRNKFVPKEMDKHNKSVDDWITFNTRQCKAIGAAPFYWETGGLLDRTNLKILDQRTLDALKF